MSVYQRLCSWYSGFCCFHFLNIATALVWQTPTTSFPIFLRTVSVKKGTGYLQSFNQLFQFACQFACQFLTVQTAVDSTNILSLERYKRYKKYRFTVQIGKAKWLLYQITLYTLELHITKVVQLLSMFQVIPHSQVKL